VRPAEWGLIGRPGELGRVVEALTSAELRAVVIGGPAGVGKSHLMAAACDTMRDDHEVEWCAATYASVSIPFGPVTRLLSPSSARDRLADVFRRTIDAIAARERPVVVAVDDAHLLDDASAVLVHQLALEGAARVALTIRAGERAPDPITALWKDGDAEYVPLAALLRAELHDFVVAVLGGPVDESTVDRLWTVTGGNLLFLREVLAVASEHDALMRVRGQWRWQGGIGAHQRVADLVHARFEELDRTERDAVRLLAFAEPLAMAILSRVVDFDVLTQLGARGLVVSGGADAGTLQLAHPLYGEVLRAELSPLEEVDACRRLAEAGLDAGVTEGSNLRWVSVWALEAGVELPLELVGDAARAALDAADFRRAEQLARAASTRRPTFDMARVRAVALFFLERFTDADAAYAEAIALAATPGELALAAMGRAQVLQVGLGRFDAAEQVLHEVGAQTGDEDWTDVLTAQRARMMGVEGWYREAGALAIPMLEARDERVRLRAVTPAATQLTLEGRTDRVLEVTATLLDAAHRRRDELPHAPMWVGSARAPALFFAGELTETKALLDAMKSRSPVIEVEDRGYMTIGYGRIALSEGRVVAAAQHLRAGTAILDETNRFGRQRWGLSLLAEALALGGDREGAEAAAAEADRSRQPANRLYQGDADRARAWVLVAGGMTSAAIEALIAVADQCRDDAPVCELYALHDVVRLGGVASIADRMLVVAARVDGRAAAAFADHAAARRARDPERLEGASSAFEEYGAILLAAEAAAEAAALWREGGHRGRATLAATRAERLGARCEGASSPSLSSLDDDSGLTPREREIAELAAQGLSSPDIARRLVVSVRTVDNHLQHVYAKLGIGRRSELADHLPGPR
jgi:ATP/maltotriose-dependent transcriptional regulator MalT